MSKVTNVKIDLIPNRDGLVGFARILIDGSICFGCIGIYKKLNKDGYRLTYPEKSGRLVFYPINIEMTRQIEQSIFDKLNDVLKKVNYDRYCSDDNTCDGF